MSRTVGILIEQKKLKKIEAKYKQIVPHLT